MIGFLGSILKVSNESTKTAAYLSHVSPVLEYCCTVWNPYTQDYINKMDLQMVKCRAVLKIRHEKRDVYVGKLRTGISGIKTCQISVNHVV